MSDDTTRRMAANTGSQSTDDTFGLNETVSVALEFSEDITDTDSD